MIWVTRRLLRDFPTWESPAKVGLILALVLLVVALGAWALGPVEMRTPALLGAGALIGVAQAIVLWANRGMVAPITRAQRAYLAGDYPAVIAVLEPVRAAGKTDPRALTLLGNAYRQVGSTAQSVEVLYEALDKVPDHHPAIYGLGRTFMITGRYADAARSFAEALAAGAPAMVQLDLAEARFRAGETDAVRDMLDTVFVTLDGDQPTRRLLAELLRYRTGGASPATADIRAALPGLRDEAARFRDLPYGAALADDLNLLERLLME